ncbi:MAG TPA: hypothetical protein PLV59_01985 [Candidatus Dojkabacteria bacterium]|nr:hypothetical protein [Candidatus Dojkabacteria bacterium]
MKKFLVLLLFVITACGGKPEPASPTPDSTPSELQTRVNLMVETIYTATNTPMNWEEVPYDGLKVTAVNYPMQYVYHVKVDANGYVTIKHLITEVETPPMSVYSSPQYTVVPLLFDGGENGLGWSGLMLIQEKEGKIYLERSLTAMSNSQLENTIDALEKLLEYLEQLQNA